MTIINIRATHGAGKSTLVKALLDRYEAKPESVGAKGKPNNYVFQLDNGKAVYVVGCYVNACGGCDGIQPYADIWPRVEKFAKLGHVIFEGALISSCLGAIADNARSYGNDFIFAFLDTPLEVCLGRIVKRRQEKGNDKPLNPKNTQGKFDSIQRQLEKLRGGGCHVVMLNYQRALMQLTTLLYKD